MRRSRASRRQVDPRVQLLGVPAAALGLTWAATVAGPGWGIAAAAVTGAAAGAWLLRRSAQLRAEALDIDSAIVSRALARSRPASDEERRILHNASLSVRTSVQRTLALLRAALRAQSALVLWTRSSDRTARVREAETCSDHLRGGVFDDRAGILARVRREVVVANDLTPGTGLCPWYEDGHEPTAVIIAPLARDGVPLGHLVVDRPPGEPGFDDVDVIAIQAAAEQISLAIHMEFLVLEAATASRDIAALDAAAARLNRALTVDDVCREARDILEQFADFDLFVVSECSLDTGTHAVAHAEGTWAEGLVGLEFTPGDDLTSRAVQLDECLPYDGRLNDAGSTRVFGPRALPQARSLLVFPLTMPQGVIGALTIASARPGAFADVPRHMLGILVHHVAAAISNALAYSRAVRMATTDGMTGLVNHRTFKERGVEALARAHRSGRPLALILTDIDHFKSVNDTHGHAVGDEVIRGVARVLASSARDVDLTARYGGEEFAVLLEDTDADTAVQIAERIRQKVSRLTFDGANGPFSVTLSLGVAEYDGCTLNRLVEVSDEALYTAKRGGRNRVIRAPRSTVAAA